MTRLGRRWRRAWLTAGHVAAVAGVLWSAQSSAQDWPQYRGPQGSGSVAAAGLLASWGEDQPEVVWRRAIGSGYSAVAAVGDRLVTMATVAPEPATPDPSGSVESDSVDSNSGLEEAVVCLDRATGETLWQVTIDHPSPLTLADPGPRSTPTIVGDRVYAISSRARLVALTLDEGRLLWSRELQGWGRVPRFGYSTSPLVDGDQVIVEVGRPRQEPGAVAFDRRSGEVRWTALWGGSGYSTPIAIELDGVRQYVFFKRIGVQALSTEGELLWRHDTGQVGGVVRPLFLPPDRIFVAASDDSFGGLMIRVQRKGDGFETKALWKAEWMRNHFNTSVAVDGFVYGFDNATLRCLDGATGERRWAKRGFGKGSLVAAGDLLFVLSDVGELALVQADPTGYRELGRKRAMEGRAWTEPSLADGRLYLRDGDELVSLDVRGDAAQPSEPVTAEGAP
ncbi:MAG: PQQ-binding-like beta-propeller repeat protein [Acidobacteriota bacterium]